MIHKKNRQLKIKIFKISIKFLIILILANLLFSIISFLEKYKYCYECIDQKKDKDSKCLKCPNEIIFKNLYIVSNEKTLKEIIKYNKSISRINDGEISLIDGNSIPFQKYEYNISKRLLDILNSHEKNLLIGIFFPYQKKIINTFANYSFNGWKNWLNKYKFSMLNKLKNKKYYSGDISRFYSHLKDKSKVYTYIKKLKKIWENRDIVMIEGEKTRFGIGNDLLNNTKSIKRILCPTRNAYSLYDKILKSVLNFDKSNLILISLGPTATILAYDLTQYGYQAIDIGHADIEYEYYIRKANKKIGIPYKFVNEYDRGKNEAYLEEAPDKIYYIYRKNIYLRYLIQILQTNN